MLRACESVPSLVHCDIRAVHVYTATELVLIGSGVGCALAACTPDVWGIWVTPELAGFPFIHLFTPPSSS